MGVCSSDCVKSCRQSGMEIFLWFVTDDESIGGTDVTTRFFGGAARLPIAGARSTSGGKRRFRSTQNGGRQRAYSSSHDAEGKCAGVGWRSTNLYAVRQPAALRCLPGSPAYA